MVERQTPNLDVGGSSPSWPVYILRRAEAMLGKAKNFLGEVRVEVKKVTWPSRKDAMGGTMVVVVVVVIVSIFLGIVDTLLSKIVEALIAS